MDPNLAVEFPPELLAPAELERVIAFVRSLPISPAQKRLKLRDWGLAFDLTFDSATYARLRGGPEPWY